MLELPLISSWYQRVQEVPEVKKAAAKCKMQFVQYQCSLSFQAERPQRPCIASDEPEEEKEDAQFIGGPRPTMTKLMVAE